MNSLIRTPSVTPTTNVVNCLNNGTYRFEADCVPSRYMASQQLVDVATDISNKGLGAHRYDYVQHEG